MFTSMMMNVFYPRINLWFEGHSNWMNYSIGVYPGWDLCIIAGAMSIGILTDNETIYNQGVNWFYDGTGNGQINSNSLSLSRRCMAASNAFFPGVS